MPSCGTMQSQNNSGMMNSMGTSTGTPMNSMMGQLQNNNMMNGSLNTTVGNNQLCNGVTNTVSNCNTGMTTMGSMNGNPVTNQQQALSMAQSNTGMNTNNN